MKPVVDCRFALARQTVVVLCLLGTISAADVVVTGRVVDTKSGELLPARVTIQGSDGKWYFPKSSSPKGSAIEYRVKRGSIAAMHTTLSADPFEIKLAPGKYRMTARRGKEYLPVEKTITVRDKPIQVELPLRRWIHMARRGWYSGDTHSHRLLGDTANLTQAEDLNISFPLSHWVTDGNVSAVKGNRIRQFDKQARVIKLDRDHLIYTRNTEYEIFRIGEKRHTLGALLIIGHKNLFDQGSPPTRRIAEQAHAEGALLDFEKHSWPWSLMLAPVAKMDLFELSNNHVWPGGFSLGKWTLEMNPAYMNLETDENGYTEWGWLDYGFQTYYSLLNCGFRIQPTAGTGSGVHPVPTGFGRVYVHQPDGFSFKNWIAGLKSGHSFVTTGPMLFMTVNGKGPGHVFRPGEHQGSFQVKGSVSSRRPVDRIEIIVNGQVARTLRPEGQHAEFATWETPFAASVETRDATWLAVRVFEKHPRKLIRFAHSSPVHIEVAGSKVKPRKAERDYIVKHLERELARNASVLSEESLAEFRSALEFYRKLVVK